MKGDLSERDQAVLGSIRAYRLMNAQHLHRLHFAGHATPETGQRVCRRTLKRLHHLGLVRRLQRRIGGLHAGSAGEIYALTPLGHRLLGTRGRKRWKEPAAGFVDHTLAITEIATQTAWTARQHGHELLAVEPEPDAWRTFHDGLGPQTLKPDLALRTADEQTERSWFIEIDLDTESRTVLATKCQLYTSYWQTGIEQAEHGVFPLVLWIAPSEQRAAQIASTFGRAGIEPRLFDTTTADRAVTTLLGLPTPLTNPKGPLS